MIILFTDLEYQSSRSIDKLKLRCEQCNSIFYSLKTNIKHEIENQRGRLKYCSKKCCALSHTTSIKVSCKQCNLEFLKVKSQIKKTKNSFCSKSCAATYNNKNKKFGTRRSKLERYLEMQLKLLFPDLEIHFNQKDAINSELDIYFPSLKLAFELNGIFHYEPIYGDKKLIQTQYNDQRKFQACIKNQISLCIIDTSSHKYVKESSNKKYLDIILNIISIHKNGRGSEI